MKSGIDSLQGGLYLLLPPTHPLSASQLAINSTMVHGAATALHSLPLVSSTRTVLDPVSNASRRGSARMSLIPRSYSTEKPSWSSGTIADTHPEKVCENGSDLI